MENKIASSSAQFAVQPAFLNNAVAVGIKEDGVQPRQSPLAISQQVDSKSPVARDPPALSSPSVDSDRGQSVDIRA